LLVCDWFVLDNILLWSKIFICLWIASVAKHQWYWAWIEQIHCDPKCLHYIHQSNSYVAKLIAVNDWHLHFFIEWTIKIKYFNFANAHLNLFRSSILQYLIIIESFSCKLESCYFW
jgi:hypothetical protein